MPDFVDSRGDPSYEKPSGLKRVEVVYGRYTNDDIVDIINVDLLKPVSRSGLVQKFKLPAKPDSRKVEILWDGTDHTLKECFGGGALLCLHYAGEDDASGVQWIQYHSRRVALTDEDFHVSPSKTKP